MCKYYLPIKRIKKEKCSVCNGTGSSYHKVSHNELKPFLCSACRGEGIIHNETSIDIRLPSILFRNKNK